MGGRTGDGTDGDVGVGDGDEDLRVRGFYYCLVAVMAQHLPEVVELLALRRLDHALTGEVGGSLRLPKRAEVARLLAALAIKPDDPRQLELVLAGEKAPDLVAQTKNLSDRLGKSVREKASGAKFGEETLEAFLDHFAASLDDGAVLALRRSRLELPLDFEEESDWKASFVSGLQAIDSAQEVGARALESAGSNDREDDVELLESYAQSLTFYCTDIPSWFPDRLGFVDVRQHITVTPPHLQRERGGGSEADTTLIDEAEDEGGQAASRRVSVESALRQHQRLLVLGDPGSGKSWALRSLALGALSEQGTGREGTLPLLVLAPLLEEALGQLDLASSGEADLVSALVRSMPIPVISRLTADERVRLGELAIDGRQLLVLVDGYDEIRVDKPRLADALAPIETLCQRGGSRLVVTTRPSSVPPRTTSGLAWCNLEAFANREQATFITSWFSDNQVLARRLTSWVREHQLEVMRSPLMLSLFCSIVEKGGEPPSTEHELWERVLLRLASDEDRHDQVPGVSELTRLRLVVLELIASQFVDRNLREHIPASLLDGEIARRPEWLALQQLLAPGRSILDDLVGTGVLRRSIDGIQVEISFLHSSFRDYLLARSMAANDTWHSCIPLIWSQPAWEPVIGYLGALIPNPEELLVELVGNFGSDPLNISRLVAGRTLAAMGEAPVSPALAERIRDELLVLLCSVDMWDRVRASSLLAITRVDGTTRLLRSLLTPAAPSHVIAAAIGALSGSLDPNVQATLLEIIRTRHFTLDEREAAVEAIADSGTDDALAELRSISMDQSLPSGIRVAAALSTWTAFSNDSAVVGILADEADSATQRLLAERIAVEREVSQAIGARLQAGLVEVTDNYSRSVLLSAHRGCVDDEAHSAVLESLPRNPAIDRLFSAAERLYARLDGSPSLATVLRFISGDAPSRLRWRVAQHFNANDDVGAIELWTSFIDDASPQDAAIAAEFLAHEMRDGPEHVRRALSDDLRESSLPPIVEHSIRHLTPVSRPSAGPPEQASPETPADEPATPNAQRLDVLGEALRADLPPLYRYGLLRVLRPQIPVHGDIRAHSALLTHRITASDSTSWIDAVPSVAPIVEARLLAAGDDDGSLVELARLRASWPGRSDEVMHSTGSLDSRVLDAGAEAAMHDGDLSAASMLALASLGASSIDDTRPSRTAISVLFAAGHTSGRGLSAWHRIHKYLGALNQNSLEWKILVSWLEIALNQSAVSTRMQTLPYHIRVSNPEVVALLLASSIDANRDLSHLISWSGCRRSHALLLAARSYATSDTVRDALEEAGREVESRAQVLSALWPAPGTESPAQMGKPKWHWNLVRIASKRLAVGDHSTAVEIYEDVVADDPTDPESRNNLGFCRMPIDLEAALEDLDAANRLFGRPFGVNVANRMLVHFRLENYGDVLSLGEELVASGGVRGSAWLWDIDSASVLRDGVDVMAYILELAERAARLDGRQVEAGVWEQRRSAWRPEEERADGP